MASSLAVLDFSIYALSESLVLMVAPGQPDQTDYFETLIYLQTIKPYACDASVQSVEVRRMILRIGTSSHMGFKGFHKAC